MEFEYSALGRDGSEVKGKEHAESLEDLEKSLQKRQLVLLRSRARKARRLAAKTITSLLNELSPLLARGLPLERAFKIVAEDSPEPEVAELAEQLRIAIKKGQPLSGAMQQLGNFDQLVISLIKVGEASGSLAKVTDILAQYYAEQSEFKRELVSTLAYPVILSVVSVASIIGLIGYVVPVFQDMLADTPAEKLPMGTRIIFAISEFLQGYGLIAGFTLLLLGFGSYLLIKKNSLIRHQWLNGIIHAPLFGKLGGEIEAFKLAKALGIMLQSGVQLSRAMELSRTLFANEIRRDGLEQCIVFLRKGRPVPEAFLQIPGLPIQFHRFVTLGNETGTLGENLEKAAELLYKKSRIQLKSLVSMLDPIIILVMGGMIGFMVISILLAVFNLSDVR